ncbi:MAG: class I SAM-dependent methyltransferase [Bacteroidales bacterium]|nr:class I SAM-dependent methyltransferase [Bacteroidales bacterium]
MSFPENNPDVVPFLDELPFWSAPFGLDLLERVKPGIHLNVLDVGTGTGFPLIELAMRLGKTCQFYGIDPAEAALERAREKADFYDLNNVSFHTSKAEHTPFSASFFHRIVSNNGFNNVDNLELALKESYRIAAPRCQFIMTMNTSGTMIEFYRLFEEALKEEGLPDSVQKMKQHIAAKRPHLSKVVSLLRKAGFRHIRKHRNSFTYRFTDGSSMLQHGFIKLAFMEPWKELVPMEKQKTVFSKTERKMNEEARKNGFFQLTIPFVIIEAEKNTR